MGYWNGTGVALSVAVVLALVASPLSSQKLVPLPELDSDGAHAAENRLWLYYHFSTRGSLSVSPYQDVCDADRGDLCFEGDHESFCTKYRCNSERRQARLVEQLAEIAEEYPASPHAVGHAVYAAVRLGHPRRASEIVEMCEPTTIWWCDLARGYVLHHQRRYVESEERFETGLEGAPTDLRCRIEDISPLLSGSDRSRYEGLPCPDRAHLHERFWWLADPFHMEEGNDRRTEHLARRFALLLHESRLKASRDARLVHLRMHEEAVVRRGFHDSWRRFGRLRGVSPWEHLGFTSRAGATNHFVPVSGVLDGVAPGLGYSLTADFEDEGYTRSDGPTHPLPAQVVRFRGGDSLFVAMASDLDGVWSEDSVNTASGSDSEVGLSEGISVQRRSSLLGASEGDGLIAGRVYFVASEGPEETLALELTTLRDRVTFATQLPPAPQLVGLEVFTPGATARHRRAVLPLKESGREISDLLLFRPVGPELPERRMRAIGLMNGSIEARRDRVLGVYWEVYGLSTGDEIQLSLTLRGGSGGVFGWLGRTFGFDAAEDRGVVTWSEAIEEGPTLGRSITVDVENVDPGEYDLVLEVEFPDGTTLTRSRPVRVLDAPS